MLSDLLPGSDRRPGKQEVGAGILPDRDNPRVVLAPLQVLEREAQSAGRAGKLPGTRCQLGRVNPGFLGDGLACHPEGRSLCCLLA